MEVSVPGCWTVSTVTDCASHRFCIWLVKSVNKYSLYTGESGYLMIPPFPVFWFMAQDIANVSPMESVGYQGPNGKSCDWVCCLEGDLVTLAPFSLSFFQAMC